ncbi:MAG: mitochondrial fission ELM1 family protein [Gammaproteobacteria bacterium]
MTEPRPLIVWRFIDGKPGHENQTAGLVQALQALRPVEVHDIRAPHGLAAAAAWALWWFPWGDTRPDPDLLLGAGHATHFPLLAARRARGGRAVVLMRPGLPGGGFDLCVIPQHDAPRPAENVFITQGVLNRVRPAAAKDPRQGLILIGGPSKHHRWSEREVIEQLAQIQAHSDAAQRWRLTSSRRTPPGFLAALNKIVDPARIEVVPFERTDANWVPAQLAWAGTVWVTADSVSMLYEALTAGAAVGLIELPADGGDRVSGGVETLIDTGQVTRFSQWRAGADLRAPRQPLNEASRVAREILQRWFSDV